MAETTLGSWMVGKLQQGAVYTINAPQHGALQFFYQIGNILYVQIQYEPGDLNIDRHIALHVSGEFYDNDNLVHVGAILSNVQIPYALYELYTEPAAKKT